MFGHVWSSCIGFRQNFAAEADLVTNHPSSPSGPRECCFRQLVDEGSAFWWRDLQDPGGLVMSGATSPSSVLDGDAPIKGDNGSAFDGVLRRPRVSAPLPGAPPKRLCPQHNSGADGLLTTFLDVPRLARWQLQRQPFQRLVQPHA